MRTGFNYGLRNSAMSARNAFHTTKGEEQDQFYGLNIGGGLIQNRASFFLRVNGNSAYDTPNSSIARTTGTTIETLKQRVPRENMFVNAAFDWAATRDQTLRFSYNRNAFVNKNQGIGGYDEPERAFISRNYNNTFRAQEVGPLGRRFFINTRLNVGWSDSERESAVETPTVRMLDAQTSGGAQKAGGRHSRDVNFASDLDYVRGIHSVRMGTAIDLNGTGLTSRTITSAPTPSRPSRRSTRDVRAATRGASAIPNVDYSNLQAALYVQDDIRLRRSLSVTPGVRLEKQTHMHGVDSRVRGWVRRGLRSRTARRRCGRAGAFSMTGCPPTLTSRRSGSMGSSSSEINIANPTYPSRRRISAARRRRTATC